MLTGNTAEKRKSRPACAHCGGTGYVYLWSVPRVGSRIWFCDRGACKSLWTDDGPQLAAVTEVARSGVRQHDLVPVISTVDQRKLQPV
jgi:ribosomal protein L37AE/L43A